MAEFAAHDHLRALVLDVVLDFVEGVLLHLLALVAVVWADVQLDWTVGLQMRNELFVGVSLSSLLLEALFCLALVGLRLGNQLSTRMRELQIFKYQLLEELVDALVSDNSVELRAIHCAWSVDASVLGLQVYEARLTKESVTSVALLRVNGNVRALHALQIL